MIKVKVTKVVNGQWGLPSSLAPQLAPFWSSPVQPAGRQYHHHCQSRSQSHLHPKTYTDTFFKLPSKSTCMPKHLQESVCTSVRGSSASRLAAGIWSRRGRLEDEDEDDEEVVCSKRNKVTVNKHLNIKSKNIHIKHASSPLAPLSLLLTATLSLSSSSRLKSRALTSSGTSWVGCLRGHTRIRMSFTLRL